ncbi:phage tail family protein [Bifidobacterium simiiventris]|uniref:phage tail family protein n=1 Tax=Bifidobacterium simiiventris TaxID=2834434 RepID=UPI001C58F39E|nr:phage tail family protein [Bifidobacterium simiiventris]MBW3077685.1 hypothetical protein [Bifidobacterium simiiventris]
MRVTLHADDGTIFRAASLLPVQHRDAWITNKGVTGLFGTPKPRESGVDMPQSDGAYWPSRLTAGGRTIELPCAMTCASSIELAALRDRLNSLMCKPLDILVESSGREWLMRGWLADDPDYTILSREQVAEFTLIVYCPDPLKYGRPVAYSPVDGRIAVDNPGMMPVWPRITVKGRVTSLSLSMSAHTVTWTGNANGLTLDFRDLIPSSGALSADDAFRIPPGRSTVTVSASAGATVSMEVTPAWR